MGPLGQLRSCYLGVAPEAGVVERRVPVLVHKVHVRLVPQQLPHRNNKIIEIERLSSIILTAYKVSHSLARTSDCFRFKFNPRGWRICGSSRGHPQGRKKSLSYLGLAHT